MTLPARYEFEDKKEYLAALHAQQRSREASTHFTTDVSKVLLAPLADHLPDACPGGDGTA